MKGFCGNLIILVVIVIVKQVLLRPLFGFKNIVDSQTQHFSHGRWKGGQRGRAPLAF